MNLIIWALCVMMLCFGPRTAHAEMMRASFYDAPAANIVAHLKLPFGTRLRLTNPQNGRSVEAVVHDRGPARWTKCELDVSRQDAAILGFTNAGHAWLEVTKLN